MKKNKPRVSVIMPVYNTGNFVTDAIESILSQTYRNLELIIVDDGSIDNTPEILHGYRRRYPKVIRLITLEKNIGDSQAANTGFRASRGEFIARMDADDISHSERLVKQIEYMLKHPKIIILGTQAEIINENGEKIGEKIFPTRHTDIYNDYAVYHPMLHPSCLFRRALLPNKEFLYEHGHKPNDDYYTFFKLLNYGEFANLNEKLLYYRIHSKNISLQNLKKRFYNTLKIRLMAIIKLGYKPSVKGLLAMLVQLLLVGFVPEKVLPTLYMLIKRIKSTSSSGILRVTRWAFLKNIGR